MKAPAEILFSFIWNALPQATREKLSGKILSLRARTSIAVPVSDAVVIAHSDGLKKQFKTWLLDTELAAPPPPSFSLLSTCYNERATIRKWLDSVRGLQHLPEELIVVDGGSSDGTADQIDAWIADESPPFAIQVVRERRMNIAEGRNRAAAHAKHRIFAFTDAGCELDRFWSERLLGPFARAPETQVSMGWYRAITAGPFEEAMAEYLVPQLNTVDPQTFFPSARSLAVRKEAFDLVGGFPEFLTLAGEDSLFDYYLKCSVTKVAFVPDALVFWHFPRSAPRLFFTAKNYARGDAEGGKLFFSYYLNLLETFGKVLLELVLFVVLGTLSDLLGLRFLLVMGYLFALCAVIRYFMLIVRYHPFRSTSMVTRKGLRRLMAVQTMVWAQIIGFWSGLRSRRKVEERRTSLAKTGHAVLFLESRPRTGESSAAMTRLTELLAQGYFVTVIFSAYPKGTETPLFEHQFCEMYLRSAFHVDPWSEKFLGSVASKEFLIVDLVNDSLSKLTCESFQRLGAKLAT